jgi:hypothetical protein
VLAPIALPETELRIARPAHAPTGERLMNVLFNSQAYFVAEVPDLGGYEIVDKVTGKGAFIGGPMAISMRESFEAYIAQKNNDGETVSSEDLDDFLRNYDALLIQRVVYH